MKVREMISALSKLDSELEVVFWKHEYGDSNETNAAIAIERSDLDRSKHVVVIVEDERPRASRESSRTDAAATATVGHDAAKSTRP